MTISLYMVIAILFSHWIADFIMQDDYTAINKSKSHIVCAMHSIEYTMYILLTCIFLWIDNFLDLTDNNFLLLVLVIGVSHFIIDSITSRINSYLWKNEKRHWFFVCIGFDQFLHVAILMITLAMIVK